MTSNAEEGIAEKLKVLEEGHAGQVDRLRRYNGELRAQLRQLAQGTSPDQQGNYDQTEGSGRPEEEELDVLEELNSGISIDEELELAIEMGPRTRDPFTIPEILDMILRRLDKKTISSCRLVCKLWDESWSRVISKEQSMANAKPVKVLELELHRDFIPRSIFILRSSRYIRIFFRNLKCEGELLEEPEFKELLEEFGWALKSLELEYSTCSYLLLRSILVDWCPNLEELKIETFPTVTDFKKFYLDKNQLSSLKRLTFDSGGYNRSRSSDVHFLTTIIGACSNLKYLRIGSISGQQSMIADSFRALQRYPKITKGLEELWMNCDCSPEINSMQGFLGVELSDKLKTLTLECRTAFPKTEISLLLKNLSGFLESLTLAKTGYHDTQIPENSPNMGTVVSFPVMPKLKVLVNLDGANVFLHPEDFVHTMPNLETFVFGPGRNCSTPGVLSVDTFFNAKVCWNGKPHLSLKKLVLLGKVYSSCTTASINQLFPNITKLVIIIPSTRDAERKETFQRLFEGILQMQNLQNLIVNFDQNEDTNLSAAFEKLIELPNLRQLTLINRGSDEVGPILAETIRNILIRATKLQNLTLVKFTMHLSTSESFIEALRRSPVRIEFTEVDPMEIPEGMESVSF